MSQDNRARLRQWLESGESRVQSLTFPQRELWEASPVAPADPLNNICAIIHLRGPLTPQGCEAAVQKVVDRQEALRISFLPGKDQPMQMVRKTGTPVLQFRDFSSTPEALEEIAAEIFARPFVLLQGPLYRAEVFRRSDNEHILVLAIHHAIADGWTLGVFVQDLFAAYLLGHRGGTGALPPVPLSYTDWGAAERAFWSPAEAEQRGAFWKSHLAGTRRLWDAQGSGPLQREVSHIPAELGRAVKDLARRNGATLFSTLLTAFQIAMSEWTDSDDILVGTPVANRTKQAVRETMGYCSGVVPLRGFVDKERTFVSSLRSVHQATVESFANAMPFVEIVKAVDAPREPGRNPLFDIRFALQNHPVPDVSVAGLSLQLRMRSTGTARFTLACEINETGDAMEVAWLFRAGFAPLDEIQDLGRLYLSTLAAACCSPTGTTSALTSILR